MTIMSYKNISFQDYRQGYQDGFACRDPRLPAANKDYAQGYAGGYAQGYAEGLEDDMLGNDSRFPEDE